ncbi:MAG TPA: SPOR domain-containing protein [Trueperaceae bacterium]
MRTLREGTGKWALVLVIGMLLPCAFAISYTVQVVALSDQAAALELQHRLSRLGFPVYMVSIPTNNGMVSRIRVGAFANRAAAVRYARAFDAIEGSMPAPALAEGIPKGLLPLEPELLASYPYLPGVTRLEVLPWEDGVALRFQGSFEGEPLEASYRVLSWDSSERPFDAWRAAPTADGGTVRIYDFSLWPDDWDKAPKDLEAYQEAVLNTVAATLDVSVDTLRQHRFYTPGAGVPYLVLVETFDPKTGANHRLPALGRATPGPKNAAGPELEWFGPIPEGVPGGLPEPFFRPADVLGDDPSPARLAGLHDWQVSGDGWTAQPDGAYTRLSLDDAQSGWRALAGFPIWARGDTLLVYQDGQIVLYALHRP